MTKQFKVTLVVLLVVFFALALGNYYVQRWTDFKMAKVSQGMAESKFPWRDYTQSELNKMYPQVRNADVPTRVAPEQTYANFRQALKDNNLEKALAQLSNSSRKRYRENAADLKEAYSKGEFISIYKKYPEKIIQDNMRGNFAQYYFNYKEIKSEKTHILDFTKDANGDWKMDSL